MLTRSGALGTGEGQRRQPSPCLAGLGVTPRWLPDTDRGGRPPPTRPEPSSHHHHTAATGERPNPTGHREPRSAGKKGGTGPGTRGSSSPVTLALGGSSSPVTLGLGGCPSLGNTRTGAVPPQVTPGPRAPHPWLPSGPRLPLPRISDPPEHLPSATLDRVASFLPGTGTSASPRDQCFSPFPPRGTRASPPSPLTPYLLPLESPGPRGGSCRRFPLPANCFPSHSRRMRRMRTRSGPTWNGTGWFGAYGAGPGPGSTPQAPPAAPHGILQHHGV